MEGCIVKWFMLTLTLLSTYTHASENLHMTHTEACTDIIKEHEGFRAEAYTGPAGRLTIGYGTAMNVSVGDVITHEEAVRRMNRDLERDHTEAIRKYVEVPLTQKMFDSLCSFVYNVGSHRFKESTLLKKINVEDFEGAVAEYSKWVYGGGKRLEGLVKRRIDEAELFEEGIGE